MEWQLRRRTCQITVTAVLHLRTTRLKLLPQMRRRPLHQKLEPSRAASVNSWTPSARLTRKVSCLTKKSSVCFPLINVPNLRNVMPWKSSERRITHRRLTWRSWWKTSLSLTRKRLNRCKTSSKTRSKLSSAKQKSTRSEAITRPITCQSSRHSSSPRIAKAFYLTQEAERDQYGWQTSLISLGS